jgi:hypothetical protein
MKTEDLTFSSMDLNKEITIKDYLKELLIALWTEAEGFSGKRPFGNSGWQFEIYECLIKNRVVEGKLDDDGYVEEIDIKVADEIILDVIRRM